MKLRRTSILLLFEYWTIQGWIMPELMPMAQLNKAAVARIWAGYDS